MNDMCIFVTHFDGCERRSITFDGSVTREQYQEVIACIPQDQYTKALLLGYQWAIRSRKYL